MTRYGKSLQSDNGTGADMPSRWLRIPIVVFWLTMAGWLFWRDLWPNWKPGEPPPFHIDPVEEVQKGTPIKTFWSVSRRLPKEEEFSPVFRGTTWIEYHPEDDTCTINARLDAALGLQARLGGTKNLRLEEVYGAKVFKIDSLASAYRVTRAGRLVSLEATVKTTPHFDRIVPGLRSVLHPFLQKSSQEKPLKASGRLADPARHAASAESVVMRIWGEVRGDQFFAHCSATSDLLEKPLEFDLPPTLVSHTGSVLLPLHPVEHIHGLRPGQSWRQPLFDPLRDAFDAITGISSSMQTLRARVLPSTETLTVEKLSSECLVIEYTNDENEKVGRTLVDRESERVLQQEVNVEGSDWIMTRERSLDNLKRNTNK
jgi:hypothetical protein